MIHHVYHCVPIIIYPNINNIDLKKMFSQGVLGKREPFLMKCILSMRTSDEFRQDAKNTIVKDISRRKPATSLNFVS